MKQIKDFRKNLPLNDLSVIFDVGANVGQTSLALRQELPIADIYAFEPVRATFKRLRATFPADQHLQCFNMALSDRAYRGRVYARGTSTVNRLLSMTDGDASAERTQEVKVQTGDRFCTARKIDHINFLKIDTEGSDLKVCIGFADMLREQKVDLLQVEAGMHPGNEWHVPIESFKSFLEPMGYSIFQIYNQSFESNRPQLRRGNVVFISQDQLARHTVARKPVQAPSEVQTASKVQTADKIDA